MLTLTSVGHCQLPRGGTKPYRKKGKEAKFGSSEQLRVTAFPRWVRRELLELLQSRNAFREEWSVAGSLLNRHHLNGYVYPPRCSHKQVHK